MFVKMWPLEYQKVVKTYLPTYLWDSSDSSDSHDSSDSSDSSNSNDSSDSSDSSDSTKKVMSEIFRVKFFEWNCWVKFF